MTQAHEQDRQATARQRREGERKPKGASAMGKALRSRAGEEVTEIVISSNRYRRVAAALQVLGQVITNYADAAAEAERTGRPLSFTVTVVPGSGVKGLAEETGDDPLGPALARAKARSAPKIAAILNDADMLTARDFGPLIGASHETVNMKRRRHELLGLEGAVRGLRYPRWQITDAGLPLPGLPMLFEALGGQPWTVYRFLRSVHAELSGNTALDALKGGQLDAVIKVARNQATGAFT